MLFDCHFRRFVHKPMQYVLPRLCLHQQPVPVRNSLQPTRLEVVPHSLSHHNLNWICVIVTCSLTTIMYDYVIINNMKNNLLNTMCVLHVLVHLCRAGLHPKNMQSLYSLSTKHKQDQISGLCGLLNTYRRTHRAVCHRCLQENDLWDVWRKRGNTDLTWATFREVQSRGYFLTTLKKFPENMSVNFFLLIKRLIKDFFFK